MSGRPDYGQDADMTVHELCLHKAGLLTWVLSSARVGLTGMNKEGLVSMPGKSDWTSAACCHGSNVDESVEPGYGYIWTRLEHVTYQCRTTT